MAEPAPKKKIVIAPTTRVLAPRVTTQQTEMLLSFMECSTQLVRVGTNESMTSQQKGAKWGDCGGPRHRRTPPDAVGRPFGPEKNWKAWRTYWNSKVCDARKRNAELAAAVRQTGGGKNPVPPLTPEEERIISLAGTGASRGNGGFRPAVMAAQTATMVSLLSTNAFRF